MKLGQISGPRLFSPRRTPSSGVNFETAVPSPTNYLGSRLDEWARDGFKENEDDAGIEETESSLSEDSGEDQALERELDDSRDEALLEEIESIHESNDGVYSSSSEDAADDLGNMELNHEGMPIVEEAPSRGGNSGR